MSKLKDSQIKVLRQQREELSRELAEAKDKIRYLVNEIEVIFGNYGSSSF